MGRYLRRHATSTVHGAPRTVFTALLASVVGLAMAGALLRVGAASATPPQRSACS